MLLCMAYLRRTSQVAALAYSNFFFGQAGIIKPIEIHATFVF